MKVIHKKVIAASRRSARRSLAWVRSLSKRGRIILLVAVFLLAVGVTTGVLLLSHSSSDDQASTKTLPTPVGPQKGTPTYGTLLPAGKSIESLGGWTRISPPDRDAVYAYIDTIGATRIIVSEQPLPKEFKDDPEGQTSQLATNYNATEKLPVGSTTVYIGTSTQGPQSVIFQRDGLLVLIKAGSAIDDAVWKQYINTLQ